MSENHENYKIEFACPKCHARQGQARDIILTKSKLLDLIPSKDNRYVEITCMLCGYTEFYNRAIYIKSRQAQSDKLKMHDRAEEG